MVTSSNKCDWEPLPGLQQQQMRLGTAGGLESHLLLLSSGLDLSRVGASSRHAPTKCRRQLSPFVMTLGAQAAISGQIH